MENKNLNISEKANFIWNQMTDSLTNLNAKKISVEQAKAQASLLKQGNNILAFQLNVAKFVENNDNKTAKQSLIDAGL